MKSPSHTPQPALEKKQDIAEAIVDAAERLLNAYGYQKMTMTDLAAEAGIGVGTTYLHFENKADVAVAVIERIHDRHLADLEKIAGEDERPDKLLGKLLRHRIHAPYEFVRHKLAGTSWQLLSRNSAEFMNDVRTSDPDRIEKWKSKEADILARIIALGCESKVFLPVSPSETANTLIMATCGMMPKNLEHKDFLNTDDFEHRSENVIQLLINGILSNKQNAHGK